VSLDPLAHEPQLIGHLGAGLLADAIQVGHVFPHDGPDGLDLLGRELEGASEPLNQDLCRHRPGVRPHRRALARPGPNGPGRSPDQDGPGPDHHAGQEDDQAEEGGPPPVDLSDQERRIVIGIGLRHWITHEIVSTTSLKGSFHIS